MAEQRRTCRCGCGETPKGSRVFVDKAHHLRWMIEGGAREMNAQLPQEVRVRGGRTSGRHAAKSGRLQDAAEKGGARSREIAEEVRRELGREGGS